MRQLITGLIIAVAAVVFAMQNAEMVSIRIFFWDLPGTSMALILLITLVCGAITGMLFLTPGIYRKNKTIEAQKKRIGDLEKQIERQNK
jgi:uncharacterized integral membrane protein